MSPLALFPNIGFLSLYLGAHVRGGGADAHVLSSKFSGKGSQLGRSLCAIKTPRPQHVLAPPVSHFGTGECQNDTCKWTGNHG